MTKARMLYPNKGVANELVFSASPPHDDHDEYTTLHNTQHGLTALATKGLLLRNSLRDLSSIVTSPSRA